MSNLIHKITDKLHGGSDKATVDETTTRTDTTTGSHSATGTHGTTGVHDSTTGVQGTTGSHSHHHGTTTEEAPVVKERVHEHTDHVDKTK